MFRVFREDKIQNIKHNLTRKLSLLFVHKIDTRRTTDRRTKQRTVFWFSANDEIVKKQLQHKSFLKNYANVEISAIKQA